MPGAPDLTALRGVGPQLAARLARIGIHSVQDLLFHLPLRYQDRTRITPIAALRPGTEAVIEGEVLGADIVLGRRRSLLCKLADRSGVATLRFFHFSAAQQRALIRGLRLRCFGEARVGPAGIELVHPEYGVLDPAAPPVLEDSLTPIYPAGDGVTQPRLRQLIGQALALAATPHCPRSPRQCATCTRHRPPRPSPNCSVVNTRPSSASPSRNCSPTISACASCAPACNSAVRRNWQPRRNWNGASSPRCPSPSPPPSNG